MKLVLLFYSCLCSTALLVGCRTRKVMENIQYQTKDSIMTHQHLTIRDSIEQWATMKSIEQIADSSQSMYYFLGDTLVAKKIRHWRHERNSHVKRTKISASLKDTAITKIQTTQQNKEVQRLHHSFVPRTPIFGAWFYIFLLLALALFLLRKK